MKKIVPFENPPIYRAETLGDIRKLIEKATEIRRITIHDSYNIAYEIWTKEKTLEYLQFLANEVDNLADPEGKHLHILQTSIMSAHAKIIDDTFLLEIYDTLADWVKPYPTDDKYKDSDIPF